MFPIHFRIECGEFCKSRKQMMENECKQLKKDLTTFEELKKSAEKQSQSYEQELRKLEAELRSRESRESTEVLMTALQAVQEKNKTLEKSLSAETRVKLDLFSALGEAKRQLEIRDSEWDIFLNKRIRNYFNPSKICFFFFLLQI